MLNEPGVQVVAQVPTAGPVPPPTIVVRPGCNRLVGLLRADKMHVSVEPARSQNQSFARNYLGRDADDHAGCHAGHDVGISRLPQSRDAGRA